MDIHKRIKQLEENQEKVEAQYKATEDKLEALKLQLAVITGQIAERQMDLQEKPPGYAGQMPVFETQEELEAALARRGKGPEGEDPETIAGQREQIYQKEALETIEFVENEQKKF